MILRHRGKAFDSNTNLLRIYRPSKDRQEQAPNGAAHFLQADFWPETDLRFAWHSILNECKRLIASIISYNAALSGRYFSLPEGTRLGLSHPSTGNTDPQARTQLARSHTVCRHMHDIDALDPDCRAFGSQFGCAMAIGYSFVCRTTHGSRGGARDEISGRGRLISVDTARFWSVACLPRFLVLLAGNRFFVPDGGSPVRTCGFLSSGWFLRCDGRKPFLSPCCHSDVDLDWTGHESGWVENRQVDRESRSAGRPGGGGFADRHCVDDVAAAGDGNADGCVSHVRLEDRELFGSDRLCNVWHGGRRHDGGGDPGTRAHYTSCRLDCNRCYLRFLHLCYRRIPCGASV